VKNFKECANYFGIWMVFMFVERSFFQNTIVMHLKKIFNTGLSQEQQKAPQVTELPVQL